MSKDTGWEKEATDGQDGVYDCTMRWTQTTKTNEDSGHGQHWAQDAYRMRDGGQLSLEGAVRGVRVAVAAMAALRGRAVDALGRGRGCGGGVDERHRGRRLGGGSSSRGSGSGVAHGE